MPAMTNPDDYYQQLINDRSATAIKGTNGLFYCSVCGEQCFFMRMCRGHWHCPVCGEER